MKKTTKEEISKIAIELFLEKGYNEVTILDICKASNITKPTFYKNVGSKEELILNFYDTTINTIMVDTYHFLEVESPYKQLLLVFNSLIETTQKYGPNFFSQMFMSNLMQDKHSFDLRDELTKLCTLIIRKGQANNEFGNKNDATALYEALAFAFTGYECMWCIKKGKLDWKAHFLNSFETILDVRHDIRSYPKKTELNL